MKPLPPSDHSYSDDPYRCRRAPRARQASNAKVAEDSSAVSDAATLAMEEPGRTHSYLPYSNHPPNIGQARGHGLYADDDDDDRPANSLMTTHHRILPPNSASSQHLGSFITEPTLLNDEMLVTNNKKPIAGSLTDLRQFNSRRHRQQKTLVRPLLFAGFALLLLLSLAFFFCWPRTPKLRLASQGAAGRIRRPDDQTDWGNDPQHPWLKTAWIVNVTLDNHDNFIPTHVHTLELIMADQLTQQPVARSLATDLKLLPRTETLLNMLFDVEYETPSIKDPTFEHLYNACGPQKISALAPPALNITLQATFEINGIAWKPTLFFDAPLPNGFRCPNN